MIFKSEVFPKTGDKNIAFVLSNPYFFLTKIFSSILCKSKFNVSNSISTNTGFKLFCTIGAIVVGNPTGETKISSPSFHPKYFFIAVIRIRLAELPEFTISADFWLYFLAKAISNLCTFSPDDIHFPVRTDSIIAIVSSSVQYGPEYNTLFITSDCCSFEVYVNLFFLPFKNSFISSRIGIETSYLCNNCL